MQRISPPSECPNIPRIACTGPYITEEQRESEPTSFPEQPHSISYPHVNVSPEIEAFPMIDIVD